MKSRKKVILLGASGSIGKSALDVIRSNPERLELVGASVHKNSAFLDSIRAEFGFSKSCVTANRAPGSHNLNELIQDTEADIVLNALPGAAGVEPSLAVIECGKDLALANKETMVCAGGLARAALKASGSKLLPVDSEHSALFQLIHFLGSERIEELVLTASGGPFRTMDARGLAAVGIEDALSHPNWSMGKKITIDSATMANKGLEVIEAVELFGLRLSSIKVLVHPESRVHSLVRATDGSMYAQISAPDMRLPIHNALFWPETLPCPYGRLDLEDSSLSFFRPDYTRFPLLPLAYEAAKRGGAYPLAFNAANEIAVEAFLEGRIRFLDISSAVAACLEGDFSVAPSNLLELRALDRRARESSSNYLRKSESA